MASPATQDVCARPKAAAHTGCGILANTGRPKTPGARDTHKINS